jgi:hypothetical protein
MANDLPSGLILPDREALATRARRDWKINFLRANPTANIDIGPKSIPYIAGATIGDALLPLFSNCFIIARSFLIRQTFGERLDRKAAEKGIQKRKDATGAVGYVSPTTATTGGTIAFGDELTHPASGLKFVFISPTKTYFTGDPVAIQGTSTGPATNLPAGTVLLISNPRQGVAQKVTINAQFDGSGLTGGRQKETDEELQDRIIEIQSNPPASGNSPEVIQKVERIPNLPVQKAWNYSCWNGPGTDAVAFTVRPDSTGGARFPTSLQRNIAEGYLASQLPTDDSRVFVAILGAPIALGIGVEWKTGASGWSDPTTWPLWVPSAPVVVDGLFSRTTTTLTLTTTVTTDPPAVGQSFALYNLKTQQFEKKRIAEIDTQVVGKSWTITCDTTNGASSLYIPEIGQMAGPWSDSLNSLPAIVIKYMGSLGPGEMFSSFGDPGARQRRYPKPTDAWPSKINEVDLTSSLKGPAVGDAELLLPSTTYPTPVGTPGVLVYLLDLSDLIFFPKD